MLIVADHDDEAQVEAREEQMDTQVDDVQVNSTICTLRRIDDELHLVADEERPVVSLDTRMELVSRPDTQEVTSVFGRYSTHEGEDESVNATGQGEEEEMPSGDGSVAPQIGTENGNTQHRMNPILNSVGDSDRDLELGLPLADLDSDTEDNEPAVVTDENAAGGQRPASLQRRALQGMRFVLHVAFFPVLVITSVAIPVLIVMFCFALMFVALVVLLCVYYCCNPRRGDQGAVPFHALIRQILEAVEDETHGLGDPANDTPKHSREEIQNLLVRRKLVHFECSDPTGKVVADPQPTDEATREERLHQDMFPVISELIKSPINPTSIKSQEGTEATGFRGFRKRLGSKTLKRKSSRKLVEVTDHNQSYELRMAKHKIKYTTDPASCNSKLFLVKRSFVFSEPLGPQKAGNNDDDNDNENTTNNNSNESNPTSQGIRAYNLALAAINDEDSSFSSSSGSSSSRFLRMLPTSSESSSSEASTVSEGQDVGTAQSSNISFLSEGSNDRPNDTSRECINHNDQSVSSHNLHALGSDNSSADDSAHNNGTPVTEDVLTISSVSDSTSPLQGQSGQLKEQPRTHSLLSFSKASLTEKANTAFTAEPPSPSTSTGEEDSIEDFDANLDMVGGVVSDSALWDQNASTLVKQETGYINGASASVIEEINGAPVAVQRGDKPDREIVKLKEDIAPSVAHRSDVDKTQKNVKIEMGLSPSSPLARTCNDSTPKTQAPFCGDMWLNSLPEVDHHDYNLVPGPLPVRDWILDSDGRPGSEDKFCVDLTAVPPHMMHPAFLTLKGKNAEITPIESSEETKEEIVAYEGEIHVPSPEPTVLEVPVETATPMDSAMTQSTADGSLTPNHGTVDASNYLTATGQTADLAPRATAEKPEVRGISSYCNICLLEYEVGDVVVWSRRPHGCHHAWHEDCLLDWLQRKPSCPNCRQEFFSIEDAPNLKQPDALIRAGAAVTEGDMIERNQSIMPESTNSTPVLSVRNRFRFR